MIRLILAIGFTFLLASCNSVANSGRYDGLVYRYFDISTYESGYDNIKIVVDSMDYEEMVARSNLLIENIDHDITIRIYQYETMIPTIITLKKIDGEISGNTFNLK